MPKTRKVREDASVVRDRVERAAMRLFALHGSPAVSVQTIADGVGMSKQAVLYHYGNKEAIRVAVLARVNERAAGWVNSFTDEARVWTLDAMTERIFEAWMEDPFVPGVILREVVEDPERAGGALQDGTVADREQIGQLLTMAQQAGIVRADLDVQRYFDRVALMLITTLALPPLSTPPLGPGPQADEARRLIRETLRIALVSALVHPESWL